MKFAIAATLLSLVGFVASAAVPRQSCPEASRFGVISVTPSTVSPGDEIIVTVDLTCAINSFDIIPKYLDYTIEVSSASNAIKPPISVPPILLARRDFPAGATSDVFTTQVPFGPYFPGASYMIDLRNTYPILGTDGSSEVLLIGGVEGAPLTINAE